MSQADLLRQRGINAAAACRQKINSLASLLNNKCGDLAKTCPTMFFDKQLGKLRPIKSNDPIDPCANYKCAIDQMTAKNNKYHTWLINRKWPGSVSGGEVPEDQMKPMNADDYLELAEQIEKFCAREVSQADNYIRSIASPSIWDRISKVFGRGESDESGLSCVILILLLLLIVYLMVNVVDMIACSYPSDLNGSQLQYRKSNY